MRICLANDGYCATGYFNPLYRKSESACFKLYDTSKTFEEAQKFCESVGGKLAEDVNKDDSSLYSASADVMNSTAKQYWIGASNAKCNFIWNSGANIEFDGLWAKDSRFYGVSVEKLSDGGLWHTTPVGIRLPFVCTFESSKNMTAIGVPSTSTIPSSAPRHGMRAPIRNRVKPVDINLAKNGNAANKTEEEDDLNESMKLARANELANKQNKENQTGLAAHMGLSASKKNLTKSEQDTADEKNLNAALALKNSKKSANETSDDLSKNAAMAASLHNKNKTENTDEMNANMNAALNKSNHSKSDKSDEDSKNAALALAASKSNKNKTLDESEDSMNAAMKASMAKKLKKQNSDSKEIDASAAMKLAMSKKNKSSTSEETDDLLNASMAAHLKKKSANESESESEKNLALAKSLKSKKSKLEETEDDKSINAALSMSKKNRSKTESETEDERNAAIALALKKKLKSKSEMEDEQNAQLNAQLSKHLKNKTESEDEMDANAKMALNAHMKKKSANESESEDNLNLNANLNASKKTSTADENEKNLNASLNASLSKSNKSKKELEDEEKKDLLMEKLLDQKLEEQYKKNAEANLNLNKNDTANNQKEDEDDLDLSLNAARAHELNKAPNKRGGKIHPAKSVKLVPAASKPTTTTTTTTQKPTTITTMSEITPPLHKMIRSGAGKPAHRPHLEPACPAEWTQYNANSSAGICFKKFEKPMAFEEARMFCIDQGGHLASIHNEKQLLLLSALLHNDRPNSIDDQTWIGLNRIHQKYYVYEDETAMDFTRWLPGAPNINDCTVFTGNELPNYPHRGTQYKFGDYPCEKKQKSVLCEVEVGKGKHDKNTKVPTCQNGWSYYSYDGKPENGKCYKQIVKEGKFEDARQTCKDEDAYVATVQNLAESRFVSSLVETFGNYTLSQQTWIGLVKYKDGNREYEWENDHNGIQFNPWTEKLAQDKNCAVFTGNEIPIDCRSKFRFVSVDCDQPQRAVLCHKPPATQKGILFKYVDTHNTVRKI